MEVEKVGSDKQEVDRSTSVLEEMQGSFDPDKARELRENFQIEDDQKVLPNKSETDKTETKNGAKLVAQINQNFLNWDSYLKEMGRKLDDFEHAKEIKLGLEDGKYLINIVNELAANSGGRDLDEISQEEIIERCQEDRIAAIRRYNELGTIIRNLYNQSNFFTRRFGKKAKKMKEYRAEQYECTRKEERQDKRIEMAEKYFDKQS